VSVYSVHGSRRRIRHTGYVAVVNKRATLLITYQPVCSLRSQDNHLLAKPLVYTSIGPRAFSFAAPQIWNAISDLWIYATHHQSVLSNVILILFCYSLLIFLIS